MSRIAPRTPPVRPSARSGRPPFPLLFVIAALVLCAGCGKDPGPEVWIIGLDCADWDQLDPMIADGRLPHLAALKQGGAHGVLMSEKPLISPVLWTTIATGRSPDRHGVTWFMTDGPDGDKIPVSSRQRRVRAVWDIASEAGLTSGVVGWWATWPVDPIAGFMISDHVGWHSFGIQGGDGDEAGRTWPVDLADQVRKLMPDPAGLPVSQLAALVDRPPADLAFGAGGDGPAGHLDHLRRALATGRGYTDLVLDRLDEARPDLLAVYYEGTDEVSHLFGDYQPPRLPWIAPADFQAYRRVVEAYWTWQDGLLGELLARRGPETLVVVVSDHGFRVGAERRKEDAFDIGTADDDHMLDGIVILNGPGIRPGTRLDGADLYDIAPTVLYALGLAVADDMTGQVLTGALEPDRLAAAPVRRVATYETTPLERHGPDAPSRETTAALEAKLRSLGYLAGTADRPGEAGEAAPAAPEEAVNLATVLMQQGRFDEAVAGLRTAADARPEVMEIRLNLAQALARTGRAAARQESEQIFRQLLVDWPDRLEVREDLATLLLEDGRHAEALRITDEGLARDDRWVAGLAVKGLSLCRLGRRTEAVATLRRAVALDPRHFGANLACGQVLLQAGNRTEGLAHLQAAHRLAPEDATAALKLAGALQDGQDHAAALAVLQRTLDSGGPRAGILAEKGAVLMRMGRLPDAIEVLRDALALDPEDPSAVGNLGVALAQTGNLPGAIRAFETVVDLEPDLAAGHAQLGALYAQSNRLALAETECRVAVDLEPDNPDMQLNLGQVYVLRDKTDQARRVFREILSDHPRLVPALIQLGRLEDRAGNTKEARRLRDLARSYGADNR